MLKKLNKLRKSIKYPLFKLTKLFKRAGIDRTAMKKLLQNIDPGDWVLIGLVTLIIILALL